MKTSWLNKQDNKTLIVFFAGWSFDPKPFEFLACGKYDVLFVYDYNDFNFPSEKFENYQNKTLIAWSMGVFAAYMLKDLFIGFDRKIAVNGTVTPVDDEFGIPVKIFELTLKHAQKGLEGKFYANTLQTDEEYQKYMSNPVQRPIQNRVSELESLYSLIKNKGNIGYEKFYDCALVSEDDKIIPFANQLASHKANGVQTIIIPYGHNPFYNFGSWEEIIQCGQTIKQ